MSTLQFWFNIAATLLILFLFVIWQRGSWLNVVIKFSSLLIGVAGCFLVAKQVGWL